MKQPEALRLAKELVLVHQGHADEGPSTFSETAAELHRLHEANQAMLEALKGLVAAVEWGALIRGSEGHLKESADIARAAIAKGEQH